MENTVRAFMNYHSLIKSNSTVLLAVSGGPDSMALLHFFYQIRDAWNLHIIAVTVDHQLRGQESLDDLEFVRGTCRKWNIEFVGVSLDVPAYQREKQIGTQVAAREKRYQFLAEQMELYQADYLAFGHHADDQLETMLMGLIHSASVKSLAGMPMKRPFSSGEIIRPLLCVTKEQIEHYCDYYHIVPKRDPSNEESSYTRNNYRHNILPFLKDKNQNWYRTTQHLSESLQEDEAFLQREAKKMVNNVVIIDHDRPQADFNIDEFKVYSRPLQRRALHLILNYLYKNGKGGVSYSHEEQFFQLLMNEQGHSQIDFPRQLQAVRTYDNMSFYFRGQHPPASFHKLMYLPDNIMLPNGMQFMTRLINEPKTKDKRVYTCPEQGIDLPLHVRTRLPGDRMRWSGLTGSKKVKDIFIDAKIPVAERNTWPVVTDNNDNVLWLPGLKKGLPPGKSDNDSYVQISYTKKGT